MAEASTKNKSLAGKLVSVLSAVEKLKKDGHNDHFNYDYVTEAAAVEHIRKLLAENGVVIIPSVKSSWQAEKEITTKDGPRKNWHSFVLMDYTLLDTESDASIISEGWPGEGMDSGDKGFYKAMTGAQKYFLLKTFMIPTGDDPEKEGNGHRRSSEQSDYSNLSTEKGSITEGQLSFIHTLTGQLKIPPEDISRLKKAYGVESSKELSKATGSDFINLLKDAQEYGTGVIDNFLQAHESDLDPDTQAYLENGGEVPNPEG